jgi:hypothetical protein
MMPEQALAPNREAIRADLEWMTRRWSELPEKAMFELRAIAEDRTPQVAKFTPDWINEAVDWAAACNQAGMNIYVVRNPIRDTVVGSAEDPDIIGAFYLWADCDDAQASDNVKAFVGPKWTAAVVTGHTPTTRVHVYFELNEPAYDLAAWRNMQMRIAAHLKSDPKVINPSRIMRVGGTISWPGKKKVAKGYISELSTLRTEYPEGRSPVSMEQMDRAFAPLPSLSQMATPLGPGFHIDTGNAPQSLDREQMRIQALSGEAWHDAVVRLVGSYVAKGMTDGEIHAMTQPLTLAGYTGEETAKEVQVAIDGARRKGWTPAPDFTPNFDHHPAPTPSDPAPQSAGWRVQTAAAFTADFVAPEYIIDGIIQRGRIYTLTAPTGSGKTAAMLYASVAIATGMQFCCCEVERGDVLFMAGENPDDVRARVIATLEFYGIDPNSCRLHFIAGTFSIRADMEKLRQEAEKLPDLKMVVIDTFAAYFDGDDENSNAQALDFARLVRRIAAFPAKPAVIMPAHPVKNARRDNLSPKGGSSLLNEVDGNLTLWNDGGILSLHWQGKFRGAEFEPLSMELQKYESSLICDNQGRIIPTILAKPILVTRAIQIARDNLKLEDKLLFSIRDYPAISLEQRGTDAGGVHKQKVARVLQKMAEQKLVRRFRTNWELTKEGERALEIIENGDGFVPEIDA